MKKPKLKGKFIKLGGGSILLSNIMSFATKEEFIQAWQHVKFSHRDKWLSDVWDLAHRNDDFKPADTAVVTDEIQEQAPETKKRQGGKPVSTRKKATSKKE